MPFTEVHPCPPPRSSLSSPFPPPPSSPLPFPSQVGTMDIHIDQWGSDVVLEVFSIPFTNVVRALKRREKRVPATHATLPRARRTRPPVLVLHAKLHSSLPACRAMHQVPHALTAPHTLPCVHASPNRFRSPQYPLQYWTGSRTAEPLRTRVDPPPADPWSCPDRNTYYTRGWVSPLVPMRTPCHARVLHGARPPPPDPKLAITPTTQPPSHRCSLSVWHPTCPSTTRLPHRAPLTFLSFVPPPPTPARRP